MAKQIQWSLSIHLWTICNHIWRITYWNDLTKDDLSNIKYNSGWKSTIVGFGVASCRTAQSILHASNITKTRRALQVTVFALYKLKRISYEIDMILEGKDTDFDIWCQEKCDEYCKRCFFFSRWVNFRDFVFLFHSENQKIKFSVTFVLRGRLRYAFYHRNLSQNWTVSTKS